jgi:hypothetical protein
MLVWTAGIVDAVFWVDKSGRHGFSKFEFHSFGQSAGRTGMDLCLFRPGYRIHLRRPGGCCNGRRQEHLLCRFRWILYLSGDRDEYQHDRERRCGRSDRDSCTQYNFYIYRGSQYIRRHAQRRFLYNLGSRRNSYGCPFDYLSYVVAVLHARFAARKWIFDLYGHIGQGGTRRRSDHITLQQQSQPDSTLIHNGSCRFEHGELVGDNPGSDHGSER